MLISVYNDTGDSTYFQQDFTENIILQPNSTIKMLKAYIPTNRSLIFENDTTISYTIGGPSTDPNDIVIPAGFYGLSQLAQTIEDLIQNDIIINEFGGSFTMTHNDTLGAKVDAFNFKLENTAFAPNIYTPITWGDNAPINQFVQQINGARLSDASIYTTNISLGTLTIEDNNPAPVKSWGYLNSFTTFPILKNLFESSNPNDSDIPPISSTSDYGAFWWKNRYGGLSGGTDATYAIMMCDSAPSVAGVSANGNISQFTNWTGIRSAMVVCGQNINNGGVVASKGDLLVYEADATGVLQLVLQYEAGISVNDQISVVIPEKGGEPYEYFHRFSGDTTWRELGGFTGTRYTNPDTDDAYMGFSAYNSMPTGNWTEANAFDLTGSFDFDGELGDWGMYAKMDWKTTETATKMGYSNIFYEKDTSGDAPPIPLAKLDESNDDPIPVSGATENAFRMPYINVNINELPLQNYTINNTDSNGLSTSRTVCSIPRYNILGEYTPDKQDAIVFDNNTQVCPLNNANEISLSQLTFTLRNADGSVPNDLATPQGFILDVQPQVI